MSKLAAPMQRCGLLTTRILAGIGSVDRMERPVCGHLSFGTQAAMEKHLAECHGGAEGNWAVVEDEPYNANYRHTCECGNPRRPELDTCAACKAKTIQYHTSQLTRRRIKRPQRTLDDIQKQMLRDSARANGMCTDRCGNPAAEGRSLCLECRQYRADQQKRWRDEHKKVSEG